MKAAIREKYGPPEILRIQEMPVPVPGPGDLLIRVHATTVSRTDCAILTGKPLAIQLFTGLGRPRSLVTGTDFAGTVVDCGMQVRAFSPGDSVWGFKDDGCSSHAEYLCIPASAAVRRMPIGCSFRDAVASIEGAHYAINFIGRVRIEPGAQVMLNGATGAIGSAMLQLLQLSGASVTAVCAGADRDLILSLGAHRVIDYHQEDFTQDPGLYDFVFDAVGKSRFKNCKRLLKPGGVYISTELGPGWENPILALRTALGASKKVIFPLPTNITGSLDHMGKLLEESKFRPLIDRIYSLEEIGEAFAYVMTGMKKGNVVLQIQPDIS